MVLFISGLIHHVTLKTVMLNSNSQKARYSEYKIPIWVRLWHILHCGTATLLGQKVLVQHHKDIRIHTHDILMYCDTATALKPKCTSQECQTGLAPNHTAAILTEAACFHVERLLDVVADLGSAVVSSQLHKVQNDTVLQVGLKHKHRQYRWWGLISSGTVA